LKVDKQGNIWIGTNGEGVFIYNIYRKATFFKETHNLSPSKAYNFLTNGYTTALEEDTQGNIWIGSNGAGCAIYSPKTHRIEVLNHAKSNLALDRILSIYCDSQGKIWIGVFGVDCVHLIFSKENLFNTTNLNSYQMIWSIRF
jgi:ligand-binding sensor domain-containing protein